MREAANHAGLLEKRPGVGDTMISFVSEPEAAALATLKTADGRCDIQVGPPSTAVNLMLTIAF